MKGLFESVGIALTIVVVAWGASSGLFVIIADVREVSSIAEDCKKTGYIQNKRVRINCTVEATKP